TLLGSASFDAARTNLGLAIGTNVQAYDADLTTYAGITPSADVQTLLGSTDNAAARSNLGLGTAAVLNVGTGINNIVQLDGDSKLPAIDGSALTNLPSAPVTSVAGQTGVITLADMGLGNVDNTSDANKPVSTATQTALDLKANTADLGTAALLDVGTGANNIVQLNGSAQLPAVDGSLLTGLASAPVTSVAGQTGVITLADMGLAIGSDIQAYDDDLLTYAGITPSANVQALLDDATFADFKTTLSLNNVENTAVSTWAGSSNITTVGTITALDVSGATTLNGAVTLGDEGTDAITVTGATSIDGSLTITNSPTADGYVLTSDISGGAIWEALPADAGGDLLSTNNLSDVANATTATQNLGVEVGVDVQAYDADLTTYAGITPSANVQSLLGSADYATARTNLGVAIGSDVQAYDADLTTYAGITPSANVQTILGAADFAAVKTSLSLNNVENTAVSTWAGSANITTVGTITALDVSGATTLDGAVTLGDAAGDAIAVTGALQILSGTPGADKVLTSDASGNATWVTPAAASGFQVKKTSALTTSATFIDVTAWGSPDLTNTNISFNATTGEVTFGAAMDVSITVSLNMTASSNTDVLSSIQILVDTGGGYGAVTGSLETELACVVNNDPGSQTLSNFFMTVASGDKIKVQNNNGGGASSITSGRMSITTYL
ncbi:beta strand repeat-containing protein, partial [Bacteroidota bacterium]